MAYFLNLHTHLIKKGTWFYLLCVCPVMAVAQQYNFRNYSVKDGVAQSQVYSLLQDSRGFLWMGTRGGGMTCFDGIQFKTFTIKDGLPNNYVSCIKEDVHHNLWIGTNNGLTTYNGVNFKTLTTQFSVQQIDFDAKGRVWLATNQGVFFLQNGELISISKKTDLKPEPVNTIYVDRKGTIWFGNAGGLFRITETANTFHVYKYDKASGFIHNSVTSIRQDEKGNLWIGTYGDGAYVYNGNSFFRIDLNLELYKQTILDIYVDDRHHVWFATLQHGVGQYNTSSKSFTWLTEKEGLSNNHVRSIIQDQSGNYWFGTSGGGVCHYFGKQFVTYDKSSGLGGNFIYSLFGDSRKRLWIGNSDKGVSVFDSSRFLNYSALNGFADVKVKAIGEDLHGIMYFGTDGQGVFTYDGEAFKALEGLSRKYIRAIITDKKGNLWIATAGTGLYQVILSESVPRLLNFTITDGILHNRLTCLHEDKNGRIWYGTENNGIGFMENDQPASTLNSKRFIKNIDNTLSSPAIRCLAEDQHGYLWVGTAGDGISGFPLYQDWTDKKSRDYKNQLTSSNIYLLMADQSDQLFVGTETGLDQVFLDQERNLTEVKHYGKGEGFTGIETCQNSVYKDRDGAIWFGTINGLSMYNPSSLVKNEHEPTTTITNVKLDFEPISQTRYKMMVGDWNTVNHLELPYDQNHLTFDFLGINFSNPEAVKYQWKLEGFDKEWSPVSGQHTFTYPNLGAGHYTFMVKACNEDHVWNKHPVMLSFSITPPFWLRWWFIVGVIMIVSSLVFWMFKWRLNRIKTKALEDQKKLQLEKEVVELEQKALRLQMNPHFIFNALNSIQSQIGTGNEQAARYYLAKFSRLMRQILDHSRQSSITLEEEIQTLENYLLIEKFCHGDRFDYTIQVEEGIEKTYVKVPPMLLQPFIENSIKHGLKHQDGKRGSIEVTFKEKAGFLECSVKDNGIGRKKSAEINQASKETYHVSTALNITKERLDLLQHDPSVNALDIIDLYDEHHQALGTEVIVRIPFL